MKKRILIGLFFISTLVLGFSWGYMNDLAFAKEITVDCCSQCTDYCRCRNGSGEQIGCYTVQCTTSGECSGIGIKCCFPE